MAPEPEKYEPCFSYPKDTLRIARSPVLAHEILRIPIFTYVTMSLKLSHSKLLGNFHKFLNEKMGSIPVADAIHLHEFAGSVSCHFQLNYSIKLL